MLMPCLLADYTAKFVWIVPCSRGSVCFHDSDIYQSCCNSNGTGVFALSSTASYTPLSTSATATSTKTATVTINGAKAAAASHDATIQDGNNVTCAESSTHVGAIAGGTVGGVIAGVILGGALVACLAYRKRKRDTKVGSSPSWGAGDPSRSSQSPNTQESSQWYPAMATVKTASELLDPVGELPGAAKMRSPELE